MKKIIRSLGLAVLLPACHAAVAPPAVAITARVKLEDNKEMAVDVYLPEKPRPAPVVMVAHGFTQDRKYHANHGRQLAAAGYVVLVPSLTRFSDHVGHARDLRLLLDWAEREHEDPASPLHGRVRVGHAAACGHSAGGLSALLAAAADPRIRALVLLDAVDWQGLGVKAAATLKIPTLSVCAEASAWNANGSPEQLATALPEPKRTVKIPGANHLEAQDPANKLGEPLLGRTHPDRQQRFTNEMIDWIKKHLPLRPLEEGAFKQELANARLRGLTLTDYHIHIRGGMTLEKAALREAQCGIRSTVLENFGREWPLADNPTLKAFIDAHAQPLPDGRRLPVGIQVNDRDWFTRIDPALRKRLDFVLADTMIMGVTAEGKPRRLWLPDVTIEDPDAWMEEYLAHNLRILGEPVSILANPTYLPPCIAHLHDRLWTEDRMRQVIAKAVANGIALEIQAGSDFPKPAFLKLAKQMGAKFSFGTNNFDDKPKDLTRWFEAIELLDLKPAELWSPK